jgi:hypothetical protein
MVKAIDEFYASIDLPAEKDLLLNGLDLYLQKAQYKLPEMLSGQTNASEIVSNMLINSIFSYPEKLRAMVLNNESTDLSSDPMMKFSSALFTHLSNTTPELMKLQASYASSYRKLVQGMRESKLSPVKYPDANSTMRLTYGIVSALPADQRNDAAQNYYTTLQGAINKYKPNDKIPFSMFLDNEVYDLYIKYVGKETIKTKYGTFNSIKFKPLLVKGTIFSGGENMNVWVTDDANHIPVRIESSIAVGTVKVDMMGFGGLRHPLTSLISRR